jgi:replication-associated recombination protein RarA
MVTSSKEHTLFVEKYRSKVLDEYVGNETIKATISKYLEQNDIQNLIFYRGPGTGKTTLAKLIVSNLDCDYIYINGYNIYKHDKIN